jgi:hypothetical protein
VTRLAARYWRELAAVLVIKAGALFLIHEAWFDQPLPRPERIRHLTTNVYGAVPAGDAQRGLSRHD